MSRIETPIWVCPLGLWGQGALLGVLGPGVKDLAGKVPGILFLASRLWLLQADFSSDEDLYGRKGHKISGWGLLSSQPTVIKSF